MGWTFWAKSREEAIRAVSESGEGWRTAKTAVTTEQGVTCVWAVREKTREHGDGLPRSFITLDLVDVSGDRWGSKSMDESMGPFYYSCPVSWFEQVPPSPGPWAAAWRERVKAYAAAGAAASA